MSVERDKGSRKSGPARDFGEPVVRTEDLGAFTYRGPLFTGLDINIKRGERVTVVGKSGSGKTVLLKNIAGLEPPMEGKVYHLPQTRVGYSPQDMEDVEDLNPNMTVKDMLAQARGLPEIEYRMRELEEKMGKDPDSLEAVLGDYQVAADQYEQLNGYGAEADRPGQPAIDGVDLQPMLAGDLDYHVFTLPDSGQNLVFDVSGNGDWHWLSLYQLDVYFKGYPSPGKSDMSEPFWEHI